MTKQNYIIGVIIWFVMFFQEMPSFALELKPAIRKSEEIHYLTRKQMKKLRVTFDHGKLIRGGRPLNRRNTVFIYIVDTHGKFYLATPKETLHHTYLSRGRPVAGAGEITLENGKVIHINNKSGHYCPGRIYLKQATKILKRHKAFAKRYIVEQWSETKIRKQNILRFIYDGRWRTWESLEMDSSLELGTFPGYISSFEVGRRMEAPQIQRKNHVNSGPAFNFKYYEEELEFPLSNQETFDAEDLILSHFPNSDEIIYLLSQDSHYFDRDFKHIFKKQYIVTDEGRFRVISKRQVANLW